MTPRDPELVSVVIPAHDREVTLEAAVRSVLGQTHAAVEVVVVDDGSTDRTRAIAERLAAEDPRVRVVALERNGGAQAARNAGIRAASGPWIAFLDSDDEYLPESVALRLEAAARTGAGIVHSDGWVIRAGGTRERLGVPVLEGDIRAAVLAKPGPLFPALLVRRELLDRIGLLDETIVAFQEWETSIRLAGTGPVAFVPEPTFVYDQRTPGAISRDLARGARGYAQVVRRHRREILEVHGRAGLAAHDRALGRRWREAGHRGASLRWRVIARLLAPTGSRDGRSPGPDLDR